jgi:hypothetical protein
VAREATRRGVLAAAVSLPLVATGCKGVGALGTPPPPLPDVAVVREAIAGETLMVSRYNAVLAAAPVLAASLRPLLDQHREHLARLRARLIEPRAGSQPEHPPSAPASPAGVRVPGTTAGARAYLRHAEQAAAQTLLGKLTAAPPSLAQLLASIAASEASHALLLGPGRAGQVSAPPSPPATGAAGRGAGQLAGRPAARAAAVRALQAALAAEHAAVYGYGAAGAHLAGARQKAAARDWARHQAARDTLAAMITTLGARPVAAAPAYRLPFPVRSGRAAVMLAAFVEDRVAAAYLGLVALGDAGLRPFGARAVQSAALRAASWRGRALAFPGLELPAPGPVPRGAGASPPTPDRSTPGRSSPPPPPTGPAGG